MAEMSDKTAEHLDRIEAGLAIGLDERALESLTALRRIIDLDLRAKIAELQFDKERSDSAAVVSYAQRATLQDERDVLARAFDEQAREIRELEDSVTAWQRTNDANMHSVSVLNKEVSALRASIEEMEQDRELVSATVLKECAVLKEQIAGMDAPLTVTIDAARGEDAREHCAALADEYIADGKPPQKVNWMYAKAISARIEAAELNQSFDLRHAADMRAIERWRAAGSDRDLRQPDHADLCVWLMEQIAGMERQNAGSPVSPSASPDGSANQESDAACPVESHHCHCSVVHECPIMVHPDSRVQHALADLSEEIARFDEESSSISKLMLHTDRADGGSFHSLTVNTKTEGTR